MREFRGLLFIGDPHLAHRAPGYRKDDYGQAILEKLRWCLEYAAQENLQPALLGDLFHWARDNANWLIAELCEMLRGRDVIGIYGNHDVHQSTLTDNDSLSVPVKAGLLRLITERDVWEGIVGGYPVVIGGTPYGAYRPSDYPPGYGGKKLVIWMMHHDVTVQGYIGKMDPEELPGIHLVINGHIHRRLDPVVVRRTTWLTPGNIARTKRSEGVNTPAVLRIDVSAEGLWDAQYVTVPHRPAEEVFTELPAIDVELPYEGSSAFVRGLSTIRGGRMGGEGLRAFLDHNLDQFEPEVAAKIRELADEVLSDA